MLEVRTNMMGINTQRQGTSTNNALREARESLSSGSRINSAADNTADVALSAVLESQIRGLAASSRNINAGNSMVRTAEAAIDQTGELLNRTRELTVQAANDTLSTENRNAIYRELSHTLTELDRVSETAQFNTRNLLDGSGNLFFQVGANSEQQINAVIREISTESLELDNYAELFYNASNDSTNLGGPAISSLINRIDSGLSQVGEARTNLGAIESRLNFANENINIVRENLTSAHSRLQDADTAFEALRAMQEILLEEAQTTMLAQANQHQGAVMRLLV
ncbi:MAG: hypothetical protein FWE02_00845 [Defluviitaleaceae bacterium]|nr:hypothetical protein [Defluviitaleaceae bacterium]